MIKRVFSWVVYFIILFAGTFLCFELWLRIDLMYIKADPFERLMLNHVHPRITKIWNDGYDKKKIFWGPPYHVFLNRGEDDNERMETIYKHSVLPSGSWYTPNFLRNPNETETSSYQVTVNSLGFRSNEYTKEKPKDTIRIVALGSYPTFGSGVNDHETYSSYLEKDLAELTGKNVEVWNGGQQGVTAITGLARLKKEILDYQPDLLIWDFGWVDLYFGEDFVKDQEDQDFSYSAKQRVLQYIWRNFPFLVSTRRIYHFFNQGFRDRVLIKDWRRIYKKMAEFTQQHSLPVLMLRQRAVIVPIEEFHQFEEKYDHIFFLDVKKDFQNSEMDLPKEIEEDFWSKPNWLTEGGYKSGDKIPNNYYYRVDAIQINKYAHKMVSEKISNFYQAKIKQKLENVQE